MNTTIFAVAIMACIFVVVVVFCDVIDSVGTGIHKKARTRQPWEDEKWIADYEKALKDLA